MKGAIPTVMNLVLAIIVIAIVGVIVINYIPGLSDYIYNLIGNMLSLQETELVKAIDCSYWRCVKGCDKPQVANLKITTEKTCSSFCALKDFKDSENKICGWNALQYPVEVSDVSGEYTKKSFKGKFQCMAPMSAIPKWDTFETATLAAGYSTLLAICYFSGAAGFAPGIAVCVVGGIMFAVRSAMMPPEYNALLIDDNLITDSVQDPEKCNFGLEETDKGLNEFTISGGSAYISTDEWGEWGKKRTETTIHSYKTYVSLNKEDVIEYSFTDGITIGSEFTPLKYRINVIEDGKAENYILYVDIICDETGLGPSPASPGELVPTCSSNPYVKVNITKGKDSDLKIFSKIPPVHEQTLLNKFDFVLLDLVPGSDLLKGITGIATFKLAFMGKLKPVPMFFDHTGKPKEFASDVYNLSDIKGHCRPQFGGDYTWNDCIESAKIPSGYKATLYDERNYKGVNVTLVGDSTWLGNTGIGILGEWVSSIKLVDNDCSATLYSDEDYGGNTVTITSNTPEEQTKDLSKIKGGCFLGNWNDCASSIELVGDNCQVILYEDVGYSGHKLVVSGSSSSLHFNGRASSIQIQASKAQAGGTPESPF